MKPKRPTRPKFSPTVSPVTEWIEDTPSGPIRVRDESSEEYEDQAQRHLWELRRYEKAMALWRLSVGKASEVAWHHQEVGPGIERCPDGPGFHIERQPGILEGLSRRMRA